MIDYKDKNNYNFTDLELIYNSIEDEEELIFLNLNEKIAFNKYMIYLSPVVAIVLWIIAIKLWNLALNKYRSTGT